MYCNVVRCNAASVANINYGIVLNVACVRHRL